MEKERWLLADNTILHLATGINLEKDSALECINYACAAAGWLLACSMTVCA